MAMLYYESSFAHHGTKGMKHGIRKYQNEDGSLTDAGRRRYSNKSSDKSNNSDNESLINEIKTTSISNIKIDDSFMKMFNGRLDGDAFIKLFGLVVRKR